MLFYTIVIKNSQTTLISSNKGYTWQFMLHIINL